MECGCRRAGAADQGGRDTDATPGAGPKFTPSVGCANGGFRGGFRTQGDCDAAVRRLGSDGEAAGRRQGRDGCATGAWASGAAAGMTRVDHGAGV